jgi:hypothetical protein
MEWLDWGVVGALFMLLLTVVVFVLGILGSWYLGGWMEYQDRRSTRTREKAEADLAQYGPTALGLRDELLPEDLREMVIAARSGSGRRRRIGDGGARR